MGGWGLYFLYNSSVNIKVPKKMKSIFKSVLRILWPDTFVFYTQMLKNYVFHCLLWHELPNLFLAKPPLPHFGKQYEYHDISCAAILNTFPSYASTGLQHVSPSFLTINII